MKRKISLTQLKFQHYLAAGALMTLTVVAPARAESQSSPTLHNLTFTPNADGKTCTLTAANADTAEKYSVVIPEKVEIMSGGATATYTVTGVAERCFEYNFMIADIEFPASVTTLGNAIFEHSYVEKVTFLGGITSIPDNTFASCYHLTTVVLPETVTAIGSHAFSGCTALTTLNLPEGITTIGDYALYNTYNATHTLPAGVTVIGNNAFQSTAMSSPLVIPAGLSQWGAASFENSTAPLNVVLAPGVTSIPESAFSNSVINYIFIPESVTGISDKAFYLTTIYSMKVNTSTPPPVTSQTFTPNRLIHGRLYVPLGSESLYAAAEGWKYFNEIIPVNNTVTDGTFTYRIDATSRGARLIGTDWHLPHDITIPAKITVDVDGHQMTLPVLSVEPYALAGHSEIQRAYIAAEEVGEGAFADCGSLFYVCLRQNVVSVESNAFSGCRVQDVEVCRSPYPTHIEYDTFDASVYSTGRLTLPAPAVENIPGTGLEHFIVKISKPENLTVDGITYSYPDSDNNVSIADGTKVTGLRELLPEVTLNVYLQNLSCAVTGISEKAFASNTSLESVTLPSSITTIGADAFSGCSNLTAVKALSAEPAELDPSAFDTDTYQTAKLTVPDKAAVNSYREAPGWMNFYSIVPATVSAVEEIDQDAAPTITVAGRDIIAPAGSRVYSLDGAELTPRNLLPGVYIVVLQGKAVKTVIR